MISATGLAAGAMLAYLGIKDKVTTIETKAGPTVDRQKMPIFREQHANSHHLF